MYIQVTEETLFNCFSVTKAVAAFAVHLLIQRGLVSLEDPVCKHWPAFAQNNKENITISHVLNHCAGLATAGFDSLLADPFITSDADAMMYLMAESTADCPPGTEVKYHALSFGWLVAGIVKSVSGVSLRDFVRENIAEAIHMEEEMMIGLGDGGTKDLSIAPRLATLVLGRPSAASPPSSSKEKDEEKEGDVAGLTNGNSRRPPSSPSVLANPTFYNHPSKLAVSSNPGAGVILPRLYYVGLREAEIPAANGHFSAQALAFFYDKLGATATESSSSLQKRKEEFRGWKNGWAYSILEKSRKRGEAKVHGVEGESLLQGRSGSFVDGFTLFPSSDESSGVITLGHAGLGGSVAFVRIDVDTGDSLAVALTLNRLSTENNDTTYRILRTIYKELNIAIPSTYNQ